MFAGVEGVGGATCASPPLAVSAAMHPDAAVAQIVPLISSPFAPYRCTAGVDIDVGFRDHSVKLHEKGHEDALQDFAMVHACVDDGEGGLPRLAGSVWLSLLPTRLGPVGLDGGRCGGRRLFVSREK